MAGRHIYWVIVTGTEPTAFRARQAEDLLPTLKQLQRTQPDAVLKWFERNRLWNSPEEARADLRKPRMRSGRGPGWRPGGSHADPRARFELSRDEKRRRFKQRQRRSNGPPVPPRGVRKGNRPKPPRRNKG
jgi:hypothetical protein